MAGQLQFLFQLGFWLPCLSAQAAPSDGIYTLFSSGEDDTASESRMALEAIRLSSLEKLITAKSLVLFNEPMTSTGAAEGVSI